MNYYTKLFDLEWVQAWMIEAMFTIFGALLLGYVICKTMDCLNGDQQ